MDDDKEKEEAGEELSGVLEDKRVNDELEQHVSPEGTEDSMDTSENPDSDFAPVEDQANVSSNGHLKHEAERVAAGDDKNAELEPNHKEPHQASPSSSSPLDDDQASPSSPIDDDQGSVNPDLQPTSDVKHEEVQGLALSKGSCEYETTISEGHTESADPASNDAKTATSELPEGHMEDNIITVSVSHSEEPGTPHDGFPDKKPEIENVDELKKGVNSVPNPAAVDNGNSDSKNSYFLDDDFLYYEGSESGTEEDQSTFMKELENFFKERSLEFKPPKFYGEGLNCLKLWRAVTKLGGYDKVTSCKLWRQVGESFRPPKTCTTVSWTFRGFYEKALLDYERYKTRGGELAVPVVSHAEPISVENQASGSGRARRDAAARAMQGWHSQRLLGNGEVSDPIIKDKSPFTLQKREKQLKSVGLPKRKKLPCVENPVKAARTKTSKPQVDTTVVDIGVPADWVKINVQRTKDCYEVYALVPGLLREEVRVQSDPVGRLVISGEPEHPDNPWGVTPFKKVVSLPSRIDPHQTSAVVTLHGQLFIRVPFEQSD